MSPPRLVAGFGGFNFVEWDGAVWRVPQALGQLDLDNPEHRARPGIVRHRNIEEATAGISAASQLPNVIETTWWEYAGRYTDFVDGVSSPVMRNIATGEETHELPLGACYAAWRDQQHYPKGPDGLAVWCKVPDAGSAHLWMIDGHASNCDVPCAKCGVPYHSHRGSGIDHGYENSRPDHRCWVRHGTVGERLTVDKAGDTCGAGGGSILTDGWHGVLTGGQLKGC